MNKQPINTLNRPEKTPKGWLSDEEFEKRLETMLEMWETHTYREIGKEFGVSGTTICNWVTRLKRLGLNLPRKRRGFESVEIFKRVAEKYKDKFHENPQKKQQTNSRN